jgi:heme/copper-type cytochrome/quinol oxidase subunit 1
VESGFIADIDAEKLRASVCYALAKGVQVRAYVITTGVVFAVLVVVHVLRAIEEGLQLLKEPPFILTTLAAAVLFVWAMSLLRRAPRI